MTPLLSGKNCENDHVVFEANTLSKEVEAVKAEWKAKQLGGSADPDNPDFHSVRG